MEKHEPFYPIDLKHLQDKALSIQHSLDIYTCFDRSEDMKRVSLQRAKDVIDVMVRDIDYLFDTKTFNGKRGLGLDDAPKEEGNKG